MTQRRIYQCAFPYHITFNVLNREWFFDDEAKAGLLHEIILNAGDIKNHAIYQFCIMPDHVHLLCGSNEENTADTEGVGKNTAGTEAPQCFSGWNDFPIARHLRVRAGGEMPARVRNSGECVRDEYDLGILLKPKDVPETMTNLMHSIKSYFVCEMRRVFDVEYKFFQNRFNYRIVTNEEQLRNVIDYITHNPIKAELPEKWSKHPYQYKNDGLTEQLFL